MPLAARDWNGYGVRVELLAFDVASHACALTLSRIRELLPVPHVTRVPGAPVAVLGLVNVRGQVVPVLDVAVRLGAPRSRITRWSLLLCVEARLGGIAAPCALLVDAVGGLVEAAAETISLRPDTGPLAGADAVSGFVQSGPRTLLLLDLDRLLDREALHRQAAAFAASPVGSEGDCGEPTAAASRGTAPEGAFAEPPTARIAPPDVLGAGQAPSLAMMRPPPGSAASDDSLHSHAPPRRPTSRPTPQPERRALAGRTGRHPAEMGRRAAPLAAPAARAPRSQGASGERAVQAGPCHTGVLATPASRSETRSRGGPFNASVAIAATLALALAGWLFTRGPERAEPDDRTRPTVTATPPATVTAAFTAAPTPTSASTPTPVREAAPALSARSLPTPPPAAAAPLPPGHRLVVVRRGDTLWRIAELHRKDPFSWPIVFRANGEEVHDPDRIRPGQRLVVPDPVPAR